MKLTKHLFIILFFPFFNSFSQDKKIDLKDVQDVEYKRSSMAMVLYDPLKSAQASENQRQFVMNEYNLTISESPVSVEEFAEILRFTFDSIGVPEKYDNHSIQGIPFFNKDNYKVTDDDRIAAYGKGASKLAKLVADTLTGSTGSSKDKRIQYVKYFNEQDMARKILSKWVSRNPETGEMSADLIEKRAFFSASAQDIEQARNTQVGVTTLTGNMFDLFSNTFAIINTFSLLDVEVVVALLLGETMRKADPISRKLIQMAQKKLGEGYIVQCNTTLYKLDWNDSIKNDLFYVWGNDKNMWGVDSIFNPKLEFLGSETSTASVSMAFKKSIPEKELIKIAVVRSMDKSIVKLQKKFDIFKTKSPIVSVDPIAVKIGMKEGVKSGDKFEVLERKYNEKTGRETFKKIAIIKAGKDIWDNQYGAEDLESTDGATIFEGKSKGLYPGLLIRQIK